MRRQRNRALVVVVVVTAVVVVVVVVVVAVVVVVTVVTVVTVVAMKQRVHAQAQVRQSSDPRPTSTLVALASHLVRVDPHLIPI